MLETSGSQSVIHRPFIVTASLCLMLFSFVLAGIVLVRLHSTFTSDAVLIAALAPPPQNVREGVNLHDRVAIHQTFQGRRGVMSHLGIGIRNMRAAPAEARVVVEIIEQETNRQARAEIAVSSLLSDDTTRLPLSFFLRDAHSYEVRLTTRGVPPPQSLSVFHEPDRLAFPTGTARVVRTSDDRTRDLVGNIGIEIVRLPTPEVLVRETLRHPGTFAACMLLLGSLLIIFLHPLRRRLTDALTHPLWSDRGPRITWRECVVATGVATAMAVIVTLPHFRQLDHISTSGDVQRALVYRKVARDELLQHGSIARWDPYLCGGEPLLANAESAQLDPFFLLVLLFGENLGTRLSVTATLIVGFLGSYLLARRFLGISPGPSLVAGAVFSFSGFQMLAFANGNYAWMPVGWIPWALWGFVESLRAPRRILLSVLPFAFLFLGGSLHMTIYAFLATAFLALTLAGVFRTWRPLFLLALIPIMVTPLVAIKLLPMAEAQAVTAGFRRVPPFLPPLSWIPTMFWDRQQLAIPQWTFAETGENYRWIEYGAYIGMIPVLLGFLSLGALRSHRAGRALWGAALITFPMIYGFFPWTLLHRLPFLNELLRNPQRARSIFLLFWGLLAALGLSVLTRKLSSPRPRSIALGLLLGIILIDLATFHRSLYPQLFRLPTPTIDRRPAFTRVAESYTDESRGYYKVSYENVRANEGVTDMCMPYLAARGVFASGDGLSDPTRPYRGEAWLPGGGTATLHTLAANTIRVDVHTTRDDWLVLNQNFFPGWRTFPAREIRPYTGLVAARVTPADRTLTFFYRPFSYRPGFLLTSLMVLILVFSLLPISHQKWSGGLTKRPS